MSAPNPVAKKPSRAHAWGYRRFAASGAFRMERHAIAGVSQALSNIFEYSKYLTIRFATFAPVFAI
jgi:hypothetical protein